MESNTSVFAELERQAILRATQRPPINGKYYELWSQNAAMVGRFIREQNLRQVVIAGEQQVAVGHAAAVGSGAGPVKVATADDEVVWWSKWGGMRAPHLHYGDGIYSVTREQWSEFTKIVVTSMAANLQNAAGMSYEGLMESHAATAMH